MAEDYKGLRLYYVGALSLLAELSKKTRNKDSLDLIERALRDGCDLLGTLEYGRMGKKGFWLSVKQPPPENIRGQETKG